MKHRHLLPLALCLLQLAHSMKCPRILFIVEVINLGMGIADSPPFYFSKCGLQGGRGFLLLGEGEPSCIGLFFGLFCFLLSLPVAFLGLLALCFGG